MLLPGQQADALVDQYNKDKDGRSPARKGCSCLPVAFKGWEFSIVMHTWYAHLEPSPWHM